MMESMEHTRERIAELRAHERICVCNDGWVSVGVMALDPETGDEVEEIALYLCKRCS